MFSWLKKQFGRVWNWVKKNFHKAVAVCGAGLTMCTIEMVGVVAADALLLPLAMNSLIGLILLCFAYFLVIYLTLTIGVELFQYLWEKCDLTKKTPAVVEETTDTELDLSPVSAANVAAAVLAGGQA